MVKKEFTATEVMALLEDLRADFRVVIEMQQALRDRINILELKVDAIFEEVGKHSVMITQLQMDVKDLQMDVKDIKVEIKSINKKLDQKAERKNLLEIAKRVTFLEKNLGTV